MVYATTGHNGQSDLSAGHVLRQAHESPQGKVKESTPAVELLSFLINV